MTGGMNRYVSRMKALRKRRIDRDTYWHPDGYWYWYNNLHQYSKNKVHCSCPLCAAKTGVNGYKISDQRKIDRLEYAE